MIRMKTMELYYLAHYNIPQCVRNRILYQQKYIKESQFNTLSDPNSISTLGTDEEEK